jgi:hypothetical protein
LPIGTITVADEIARRRVPGECLHHLLRQPLRRWMPSHRKPQQPASTMAQDKKRKQVLEMSELEPRRGRIAAMASAWLRRNVCQLCDGGPRQASSKPINRYL